MLDRRREEKEVWYGLVLYETYYSGPNNISGAKNIFSTFLLSTEY